MISSADPIFLDHYCERVAPGIWGEPYNLLSNLAFIIAGGLAWRYLSSQRNKINGRYWDLGLLITLLFAIGVGSGLWHLFANDWSLKTDTIPILLFINIYLLSCLFRVFSLSVVRVFLIFVVYHIVNAGLQTLLPVDFLNGSIFYLPTWLFLLGITLFVWKSKNIERNYYASAFVIFSVSLTFRTIDIAICNTIPTGTHFIWHLLNAVTLYLLMLGLINATVAAQNKTSI